MEALTAGPLIHGEGTDEAVWRSWLHRSLSRPEPFTQWLPDTARLVVLAPHPDDEVLGCGALLALHTARGGESLIVAVTDGEGSHRDAVDASNENDGASVPTEIELSEARRRERLVGMRHLDLRAEQVVALHLPDGEVARHEVELAHQLKALICPADVIVSPWRYDGHPDHDACGRAASRVSVATGRPLWEAPIWMWHWAQPNDARVPWMRLQAMAVSATARANKHSALLAHASQLTPRGTRHGPVLGGNMVARAGRPAEYFFV